MAKATDGKTEAERFHAGTKIGADCYTFEQNLSQGYGRFTLRVSDPAFQVFQRKHISAHIFAWWLHTDVRERSIYQRCGNKLCVRVEHLFVPTPHERFLLHINEDGPVMYDELGPCHEWKTKGTSFWVDDKSQEISRAAWQFAFGDIPKGLNVLHRCDNRKCVRTKTLEHRPHLYLGTQKQNIADMISRKRAVWCVGARSPNSRMSEAQVRLVHNLADRKVSPDELALLLNVEITTVERALRGETYADIYQDIYKDNSKK